MVVVPLTSNPRLYDSVPVTCKNMEDGKLIADSQARVDKIFSVEKSIILKRVGKVDGETHAAIRELLFTLTK